MQKTKDKMIIKMQRITSLEAKVIYLIECIKNTVKLFVFKQRICIKSKLWWNNEFIKRRKTLSSKKRIWKRCRSDDIWAEIVQTWNSYHDAIKLIKNQFWINFLNNVEEKEVFQTYKLIKSRLIEKLFSIQNLQKELKIEFNEKCKTFLKAMYSSSLKIQINEELILNESIQWSRVIDHVALKQLVKILIKLKISVNIINWVKCFLQNRIIDLAFDDERQKSKKISTEISQDSFISLILFLIYIWYLFSKIRAKFENLQSLSYIDDVTLYVEERNIDKNVKILKNAAKIAFTWAENNIMQFNDLKSELIHFESHKTTLNQMIILLNNMIIKSKTYVQWLEVWLNRKLNFKVHVQTKIATVTRTLHSLFRLMNSEWELNVKSEKQLYLTCVTFISDYDVEIWWNNQKSYLVKFRKLQNAALRKILSAFQTSLINVYFLLILKTNNWRQRSIKAYNISNRSISYRAQSYDQNKLSFDSITSQMITLQVKNRKSKFFALMQIKINDETRVHQCRRKNHQFRQ